MAGIGNWRSWRTYDERKVSFYLKRMKREIAILERLEVVERLAFEAEEQLLLNQISDRMSHLERVESERRSPSWRTVSV